VGGGRHTENLDLVPLRVVSTEPTSLSVVIPTRDGSQLELDLDSVAAQVAVVGGEIVVVDGRGVTSPENGVVRWIGCPDDDLYRLRATAIGAATGAVVAIGEDHVVPRPDWPMAVLRAHAEHPDAPAISGCLANGSTHTCAGRANFLAFAASFSIEMADTRATRPPPSSTLSFKRDALTDVKDRPGELEGALIPELFERGALVRDKRVVVDNHQDHGIVWSIRNAFWSARSSYGATSRHQTPRQRRKVARWALIHVAPGLCREAKAAARPLNARFRDLVVVAAIATAAALGAAIGALFGPGRAPNRVA
jgi:hypothetical protein